MNRRTLRGLGSLQEEVLDIVWQRGAATVADVVAQLEQKRPVRYTTVLVALQKLEKKGWLGHRSEGRAYVYTPLKSREQAGAGLLGEVLETAFGGDPTLLVTQLLDSHPWSETELNELKKLIELRRKEKRHG
jgi:predicted transcriptional regulator